MSEQISVTMHELSHEWSYSDLMDAHDVLNAHEAAVRRSRPRAGT